MNKTQKVVFGFELLVILGLCLFISTGLFKYSKKITVVDTLTPVPTQKIITATPLPTTTPTPYPTGLPTPTPTFTPTPFYNAVKPLRIKGQEEGTIIDFEAVENVIVTFNNQTTTAGIKIYDGTSKIDNLVGGCSTGGNLVISNARSGNEYVTFKTLIYAHSGACKNQTFMPFEYIREFIEGPFYNPNVERRTQHLKEIIGMQVCFNEACFTITDATYVTREEIEQKSYVDGKVDWYFESGEIPDVQEIFLGFCGSEGGLPNQWFSAKYYLRLQRIK